MSVAQGFLEEVKAIVRDALAGRIFGRAVAD